MPISQTELRSFLIASPGMHDLARYADRIGFYPCPELEDSDQLAAGLALTDLKSVDEIEQLLVKHDRSLRDTLQKLLAYQSRWRASFVFICWLGLITEFPEIFDSDHMQKFGWDKPTADDVIRVGLGKAR